MNEEEATALRDSPDAQEAALGTKLNSAFVEVFPVADLEGVGLVGYLSDGAGVSGDQLAPEAHQLLTDGVHPNLVEYYAFVFPFDFQNYLAQTGFVASNYLFHFL